LWPDATIAIGTVALAFVTLVTIIVTIVITRRDRRNAACRRAVEAIGGQ
jgi:hypothetical protein